MWNKRESPLRIEKRFEFEEYKKISKFMEQIDQLCKEKEIYPNISFGKNFVSLSIFIDDEKTFDFINDFSNQVDQYFLEI